MHMSPASAPASSFFASSPASTSAPASSFAKLQALPTNIDELEALQHELSERMAELRVAERERDHEAAGGSGGLSADPSIDPSMELLASMTAYDNLNPEFLRKRRSESESLQQRKEQQEKVFVFLTGFSEYFTMNCPYSC